MICLLAPYRIPIDCRLGISIQVDLWDMSIIAATRTPYIPIYQIPYQFCDRNALYDGIKYDLTRPGTILGQSRLRTCHAPFIARGSASAQIQMRDSDRQYSRRSGLRPCSPHFTPTGLRFQLAEKRWPCLEARSDRPVQAIDPVEGVLAEFLIIIL